MKHGQFEQLVDRRRVIMSLCAAGGLILTGCARPSPTAQAEENTGAAAPTAPLQRAAMVLHKDPNCGCCQKWAEIAQGAGYPVTIVEDADLTAVKTRLGVPEALASCHTTEVGGFVVEGHVPLEAVERLLRERPAGVRGIAVPGMPAGSPGMETPDGRRDPFEVIAFLANGQTKPFA